LFRYKKSIKLAGIVYLHKITDNRMAGAPHRNLRMFAQLCGDQGVKKVILVTTMWDTIKTWTGAQREHDLRRNYWSAMMEKGALVARFRNTQQTAWKIIDMIIQDSTTEVLLLQEELVDLKLRLNETKAGIMLYSNLQELLLEQQRTIQLLAQQARGESDPVLLSKLAADHKRIEKEFQKTFGEMKHLHIPIGRRIILFFSRKSREATVSDVSNSIDSNAYHYLSSAPWASFEQFVLQSDPIRNLLPLISRFCTIFLIWHGLNLP
jgi:hypothetical protein